MDTAVELLSAGIPLVVLCCVAAYATLRGDGLRTAEAILGHQTQEIISLRGLVVQLQESLSDSRAETATLRGEVAELKAQLSRIGF